MAAKGYCTVADVEQFLGRALTAAQFGYCDSLIERAERWIDNYTHRGWAMGEQVDEAHFYPDYDVWLRYAPVATVGSVSGRAGVGEGMVLLTAGVDYEAQDPEWGRIRLIAPGSYDLVRVTYTPVAAVPGDIQQACTELVTAWMQPGLNPGSYGLDSYSLPDLTVRFARSHVQMVMPPTVTAILDMYRYVVAG